MPNLAQTVEPFTHISPAVKEIVSNTSVASHVLGLKWDHVADTLNVSRGTQLKENRTITQRTFDPLGLVAPFTVQARVLLKEKFGVSMAINGTIHCRIDPPSCFSTGAQAYLNYKS